MERKGRVMGTEKESERTSRNIKWIERHSERERRENEMRKTQGKWNTSRETIIAQHEHELG